MRLSPPPPPFFFSLVSRAQRFPKVAPALLRFGSRAFGLFSEVVLWFKFIQITIYQGIIDRMFMYCLYDPISSYASRRSRTRDTVKPEEVRPEKRERDMKQGSRERINLDNPCCPKWEWHVTLLQVLCEIYTLWDCISRPAATHITKLVSNARVDCWEVD